MFNMILVNPKKLMKSRAFFELKTSFVFKLELKTSFLRTRAQNELFRALNELELKKSSNELRFQVELYRARTLNERARAELELDEPELNLSSSLDFKK